jgi:hypothetical protein
MKARRWSVLAVLVLAMLLGAFAIVRKNAPAGGSPEGDQTTVFSH